MPASLEPVADTVFVLRAGPDHSDWQTEDPYEFSCTVVLTDEGSVAEMKGVVTNPAPYFQDIALAIYEQGIDYMVWDRFKNGRRKHVRIDLNRYIARRG